MNNNIIDNINIFPPIKNGQQIIVLGDIHGDLQLAIKLLLIAGVIMIDNNNVIYNRDPYTSYTTLNEIWPVWIGCDTIVVQLGDQIDSKRIPNGSTTKDEGYRAYDFNVLLLFDRLDKQAQAFGGRVISLLGNHEIMNFDGDPIKRFSYVNDEELNTDNKLRYNNFFTYEELTNKNPTYQDNNIAQRIDLLSQKTINNKQNKINETLINRKAIVIIGDLVFVHGGLLKNFAKNYNIKEVNEAFKQFMINGIIDKIISDFNEHDDPIHRNINDENAPNTLINPLWNRSMGRTRKPYDCKDWHIIKQEISDNWLNNIYTINGIFVGHTPQMMDGINEICNKEIWRVDTGSSYGFEDPRMYTDNYYYESKIKNNDARKPQVLIITKSQTGYVYEIKKSLNWSSSKYYFDSIEKKVK